jgi:hypothetical protein
MYSAPREAVRTRSASPCCVAQEDLAVAVVCRRHVKALAVFAAFIASRIDSLALRTCTKAKPNSLCAHIKPDCGETAATRRFAASSLTGAFTATRMRA